MQVTAIMAQILSLVTIVFLLFLTKTYVQRADSLASSLATTTYDEWYQSGMDSYTREAWDDTIFYFEKALEEFSFYRARLVECRLNCQNVSRKVSSVKEGAVAEMLYFQGLFMKANCIRKCKRDKLGSRPEMIDNDVTDKFLSRMPYSYLQFAYYKNFEYEKAVAAAYTYVQWNPTDDVMQNNLHYYSNLHGITDEHLIDLEEQPHQKYFMEGYKAYENEEWATSIEKMEKALEYYWIADEECRALCEGKYENREFMDLYEAISNHFASVLFCKSQCEEWNSRMKGGVMKDFLPNHFHFLQFSYYKVGKLKEAVDAAASFLILVPNDPTMANNMQYYEEDEGVELDTVTPSPAVKAYQERKDTEQKMLQFASLHFWDDEELEFLDELYLSNSKSTVYQDQAEPINPDEVVLASHHPAMDQQDNQDLTQDILQQEEYEDYLDEYEEADIQHFPELNLDKPEELWLEEFEMFGEGEAEMFEDGPDREYSPEPGVLYSMEDALRDMAADAARDERAGTSLDSGGELDKHQDQMREDFVDPNLGYRVDKYGVKWPKVEQEESKSDSNTGEVHKECQDADGDKTVKSCDSQTDKGRLPANGGSVASDADVRGVSALDGLRKTVREEQELFPSGPPQAGPSIQGRRYVEEGEVEGEVEEVPYTPSLDGVKLYKNAGMLNGSKRMAADNIATQMECDNLVRLMDIEAKMGDGYNGKVYPHTKFESFEGMTVSVAVNAAKAGRVPLVLPATYMHLAEKSRVFLKKYFTIKNELYFSYSHLVCRTAEPDSTPSRKDLSHPIHADNCHLDAEGVCHKSPPAFTWRDWSGVLYLNDNFEGGEFVFAHPNLTFQSELTPRCGRLVGFSAGEENLHGVKAVISGRRCALALWFTEDPRYMEHEFGKAAVTFRETWEEQAAMKKQREMAKAEL